jgi:hypothetical protein
MEVNKIKKERVGVFRPIYYYLAILQHSRDILVRIACNGQHRDAHTPERKHRRHQHTDCRIALQIGCPLT